MTTGEETAKVGLDDSVFIPPNAKHGLINKGNSSLRYYNAASPSWGNAELTQLWPYIEAD